MVRKERPSPSLELRRAFLHEGINPFTGEEMMFKAKPASRKVKILATKALKDIVA